MKLRNLVSRFTSILLVMLLVFSFVACGDSSSDDDDDKDEKSKTEQNESNNDNKKEEASFEDIVKKAASGEVGVITTDMVNEITEDEVITYDEVEKLLKQIPSYKAEAEAKLDCSLSAEADDEEPMNESIDATMNFVLEYDSENMAFYMGFFFDGSYAGENMEESVELWIVNEDGTFYGYQKEGDDVALRTEFGNIEEAFGEGLDLNELKAEMESEMEEYIDMYEEMYATAEDFTESELINALSDYIKIEVTDDFYEMVMDFSASKIIDLAMESEELAVIFEEAGFDIEEIEALLDMDVIEGVLSAKELIDMINFDINYSVDVTDLFLADLEIDLADCLNDIADVFEDYLLETAEEQGATNASVDIKFNDAYISYTFDNDAKVTVEFDGEYMDSDDYYDEYYDYDYEY